MQLPTGAGKTLIFSEIAKAAEKTGRVIWILVPRNELLQQASEELADVGVNHGIIAPGYNESRAYNVHVVSKDTLIRRYDRIKRPPDFIIVDEAHLALERYKEIAGQYPEARILGVTATPERLDGRGLSELYDVLVEGPKLQALIEAGFLSDFRYFCPPIEGLKDVPRRGTEYAAGELQAWLERRKIYGHALEHYRKYADGRPALVYCRSIKAAAATADRFSAGGYRFENIDGNMTHKRRRMLINALRTGEIHGLTSCDLITYGLDVPRVEAIIMLRPTLSRSLYCQMVGRGLRISPGKNDCVILDHVGNLLEHGHPLSPYRWKFDGRDRRRRRKAENNKIIARLCPDLGFLYCDKPTCTGCEHYRGQGRRRELEQVEGNLAEVKKPVKLAARPVNERAEYIDRIGAAVDMCRNGNTVKILPGPIGDLLEIASELGYSPMWVYQRLTEGSKLINVTLLHEIARQKKYKTGWAWYQKKRLERER